jgi:hypothetical protein
MRIGTRVGRGCDGMEFKMAVNRYVPKDAIDPSLPMTNNKFSMANSQAKSPKS